MTITDTLANVNTALATVQYSAVDNGSGGATAGVSAWARPKPSLRR